MTEAPGSFDQLTRCMSEIIVQAAVRNRLLTEHCSVMLSGFCVSSCWIRHTL